jgi:predicted RNase H-like HicB family nuclease
MPEYGDWQSFQAAKGSRASVVEAPNWKQDLSALLREFRESVRLEFLAKEIVSLKERVAALEIQKTLTVPVESLAPEPYEVIHPFHVVLRPAGEEYVATFFDANISATGETEVEAVENLKDVIVAGFDMLTRHKESELGPGPLRQINVLRSFIRRIE